MNNINPIIGISVGDINGIGLEVLIKTFQDKRMYNLCTPVLYANNMYFLKYIEKMNFKNFRFHSIKTINNIKKGCLNIINVWNEKININYGIFEKEYSKYSISSLKTVLKDALNKNIDGVITLPVNKNIFEKKEIVGHTEYISNIFKVSPLMIMCNESLKIAIATTHIPLKEISKKISVNLLKEKLTILYESLLNDFKIEAPKIAILGLNPHAGDDGKIGEEEKNIIKPFIDEIKNKILCFGPYSADSFFSNSHYKKFDAIMSLYHDQGLIPFKTISFKQGTNFTAGIPIIRTSPDHGCGYDIAGKKLADENSFRQTIYMTLKIIKNRNASL